MLRCLQHPGSEILHYILHITYWQSHKTGCFLANELPACLRRTGSSMVKSNTLESSQWSLGRAAQAEHLWFGDFGIWGLDSGNSVQVIGTVNCFSTLGFHWGGDANAEYFYLHPLSMSNCKLSMTACVLPVGLENTQQISPQVSVQVWNLHETSKNLVRSENWTLADTRSNLPCKILKLLSVAKACATSWTAKTSFP